MLRSLLCAAALAAASPLFAAPHLVTDLNTGPNTVLQTVAVFEGKSDSPILYFPASDPAHGRELWRSDGTASGTWRLTDICPGRCDANPGQVTVFKDRLFFVADDGVSGTELWMMSAATPGSERRVRDLCAGPCGVEIGGFQALGDGLLFATSIAGAPSLWRTDGTRGGTVALKTLPAAPWFDGDGVQRGGVLYFIVSQGDVSDDVWSIWRTDGTAAGTQPLSARIPGLPPVVSDLTMIGDVALFWAKDGLWRTDFTAAGTWSLSALVPGLPPLVHSITPFGGSTAFFWAHDALWRTDGTAAGTLPVKKVEDLGTDPLDPDQSPFPAAVWNGALYSFVGRSLVRSDGTAAGTEVIHTFSPEDEFKQALPLSGALLLEFGPLYFAPSVLWRTQGTAQATELVADLTDRGFIAESASLGDRAVFRLYTDTNPGNLDAWVSDGTATGTHEIALHTGFYSFGLNVAGGQAFFVKGGFYTHHDLWRTDGTAAGTYSVHDFTSGPAGSGPLAQAVVGEKLVFAAQTGRFDAPLFMSDGTAAGTAVLNRETSWASGFTAVGGRVFFPTFDLHDEGVHYLPGLEPKGLGVTDGTIAGTRQAADGIYGFSPAGPLGNLLVFSAKIGQILYGRYDTELWRSDGTGPGTWNVKNLDRFEITTGFHHTCIGESSGPGQGVAVNGRFLFPAGDGVHGRELWSTDGTRAGTRLVRDINPAVQAIEPDFDGCNGRTVEGLASNPSGLTAFQGGVLFAADDGATGRELWRSDGTAAGTRQVKDLLPGPAGSDPRELTPFHGAVYFFAARPGGAPGDALWRTDGTRKGTVLVDNLTVGGTPSWARSLTAAGDRLFFSVYNEATGAELWASRGTAASTGLVTDLRPGRAGSYPQQLTAIGNILLFAATDGQHGLEPWRSDGTAAGTRPLGDLRPGLDASSPGPFSRVGSNILFGADDGEHGRELWAVPVEDVLRP